MKALCEPGEGPHQEPNHGGTLILDFQPPELWEINVCCLSHPVYGVLLWQHKLTKVGCFSKFLLGTAPTLISQHYACCGFHTSLDTCLFTGGEITQKPYQAELELWRKNKSLSQTGMAPEINWVGIYFTQIDPVKTFVFFFNVQNDFFSVMADRFGYKAGWPFPKKLKTLLYYYLKEKWVHQTIHFWMRNKGQIIYSLCVLHFTVHFSSALVHIVI